MNKHATILVTGSKGLVGTAVCGLLAERGYTAVIGTSSKACDLRDRSETRHMFNQVRPDYVIHCAARVYGIMGNMNRQAESFYENTLINTNVIDACTEFVVKKIVALGTGAVYPAPPKSLPLKESEIFDGRPDPHEAGYAHAKRGMLAMLEAYETSYGLDWAYIVSCNLFGPNDKFDPVNGHVTPALVRKFFEAKRDGTQVTIWGDGSAQRDFLYVADAARVVELAMNKIHGPVNMGSGTVYRIRDVVNALSDASGLRSISIRWDASKPNGQPYRGYDLSKLHALGFQPEWSLERGIAETWKWYVEHHGQ